MSNSNFFPNTDRHLRSLASVPTADDVDLDFDSRVELDLAKDAARDQAKTSGEVVFVVFDPTLPDAFLDFGSLYLASGDFPTGGDVVFVAFPRTYLEDVEVWSGSNYVTRTVLMFADSDDVVDQVRDAFETYGSKYAAFRLRRNGNISPVRSYATA